jgi:hypothetical protein
VFAQGGTAEREGCNFETFYLLSSPALTAFGWSLTLNVLLVRRDGRSDCGPLYGAFEVGIGGLLCLL